MASAREETHERQMDTGIDAVCESGCPVDEDGSQAHEDRSSAEAQGAFALREKLPSMHNKELGRRGEDAVARFLERRGYQIIERNWVCPAGEADIIARDQECLVFVEVKTRSSVDQGFPSEAVDERKRTRYEKIAAYYLREFAEVDIPVRFDVIGLLAVSEHRAMVRHHVNAFGEG